MSPEALPNDLPTILAALRQEGVDGELVLEQNDGIRRLYWRKGELVYLHSDAAGEQFGNYLLRQGVIDFAALNKLLANDERYRFGEKVVQWGLLTVEDRDAHLRKLQEQVMVNALEHPVLGISWNPDKLNVKLSEDLQLKLDHRHFIWRTFMEAHNLQATFDFLLSREDWKWEGIPKLLETLSDLPLTPANAYALSFLGSEPISFDTFLALSGLSEEEATRIFLSLWAVGALILTQGTLPALQASAGKPPVTPEPPIAAEPPPAPKPPAPKPPAPKPPPPPAAAARASAPPPAPAPAPTSTPTKPLQIPEPKFDPSAFKEIELDLSSNFQPEFLEVEQDMTADDITIPMEPLSPEPQSMPMQTSMPKQTPLERARSLHRKARQLHLKDRTGEAIHCLELSVQLDPSSESAYGVWLLLGQLRMTNPAWSTRAINALQAASRIMPKAADPWVTMGLVYYRKGFRTNAVACFHKALELDPSVPIPPEVDYRDLEAENPPQPPQPTSFFGRVKMMLKGSEKG